MFLIDSLAEYKTTSSISGVDGFLGVELYTLGSAVYGHSENTILFRKTKTIEKRKRQQKNKGKQTKKDKGNAISNEICIIKERLL